MDGRLGEWMEGWMGVFGLVGYSWINGVFLGERGCLGLSWCLDEWRFPG